MGFLPRCHSVPVPGSVQDCLHFGRGEDNILILPGLSTRDVRDAGIMLSYMYRDFAKEYTVWVFDKRRDVPEDCSPALLAEDCACAMAALGIKSAHVLGVSLGGMIAQELAIRQPGLVRSLVPALTAACVNSSIESAVGRWIAFVEKGDYTGFGQDMMESMYSPAYLEKYRLLLPLAGFLSRPRDKARFLALARACLRCDTRERLSEISCPALVIGAAEDKVVSGEASLEIAERLGCPLRMYPGLGHAAYDEAGDFNRTVLDFFRRH